MNYLEHETEVKYVDGLLAHSQEWQWLIEKIQERFEVKEVDSWEEYLNESIAMRKMFQYFVKVLEVCDGEWKYRKVIHAEMWEIAKFYIGKISLDACMQKGGIADYGNPIFYVFFSFCFLHSMKRRNA